MNGVLSRRMLLPLFLLGAAVYVLWYFMVPPQVPQPERPERPGRGAVYNDANYEELERLAAQELQFDSVRLLPLAFLPGLEKTPYAALGIHFVYLTAWDRPTQEDHNCGPLGTREAEKESGMAAWAVTKIPPDVLKKADIRYIVLCGDLVRGEADTIGGAYLYDPANVLMVNAHLPADLMIARVFHEIYHQLEYALGLFHDKEWERRFGAGYRETYGTGYKAAMRSSASEVIVGGGRPGFLNPYSETYAYEERAEIFTALMMYPQKLAAHIARTGDAVLAEKVAYVRARAMNEMGVDVGK